ncbi:MAG: Mg-chelatase subunit ChlD [Verrucomicrobiales bacterium]|nr:Mg-chelatase subunit ChlD [Verrucomicrobiales bacterium]
MADLVSDADNAPGWRSKDGYLPQDIVFAFDKDEIASIDRIIFNPKSSEPAETRATHFLVLTSQKSPLSGFKEVGQFELAAEPKEQTFTIQQPARFLKIRVIKNGGGPYTSIGKIRIIEGPKTLLAETETRQSGAVSQSLSLDEADAIEEKEPNNSPAEAAALVSGQKVKGRIDPLGEQDNFRLSVPGRSPSVITFHLKGQPNIRTSLSLLDAKGKIVLKQFNPGQTPERDTTFSWKAEPGDYLVQLTEPVSSMVLVWDTSESMRNDIGNLKMAVEAYLDEVKPSERLKLIRFSKDVEVITPEFLSDPKALKAAAAGKFQPIHGTSIYGATAKAIELLEGAPGNRAIILMTDGSDSSSVMEYAAFWKLLDEKKIRLYTIALGGGTQRYSLPHGTVAARMLKHASLATDGQFFQAKTSDELKGFYQQIAKELRTVSTYYLQADVSQDFGNLSVVASGEPIAAVSAPPQLEIILDASYSMNQTIGIRKKIDIAKEALTQIVKELPDDVTVGLRIYGHRIDTGKPGDCEDSELVVPFRKVDKNAIISRVKAVKALGNTPIAYSLGQLAADFRGAPGEKIVILATDGKEDCNGNPPSAVRELQEKGIKFRLEVIGLAFADRASRQQMEEISQMTGGRFHEAKDAKTLVQAFQRTLAVPYDLVDSAGEKVMDGLTGQSQTKAPEGTFTVVIHGDKPIKIPNVRISKNRLTRVALKKEGQEIGVQVQGP